MTVRTVALVALGALVAGIVLTVTANVAFDNGLRAGAAREHEASKPCRMLTI